MIKINFNLSNKIKIWSIKISFFSKKNYYRVIKKNYYDKIILFIFSFFNIYNFLYLEAIIETIDGSYSYYFAKIQSRK